MWSASSPRAANHRLGASGAEGSGCVAHAPCFPPGVPLVSSTAKSGTRHDVVPLSLPSCAASHEPVPAMVQFSPFVFVVSSGCRRGRRFQLALVQQITEPSKMTKAFQHRSFYRFSLLRCFASASRPDQVCDSVRHLLWFQDTNPTGRHLVAGASIPCHDENFSHMH